MNSTFSLILLTLITNLSCGLYTEQITVEGEENQAVVLPCVHPQNAEVRWSVYLPRIKDFIKILRGNNIVDTRFRSIKFGDNQTNLIILNIKESDLGLYKCRGRSGGTFFSQIFNLTFKSLKTKENNSFMTTESEQYLQKTGDMTSKDGGVSQRSRTHSLSTGIPTSIRRIASRQWLSVKVKDITTEVVLEINNSEIRQTSFIVREKDILFICAGISFLTCFLGFLARTCIKRIKSSSSRDMNKLVSAQHKEVVIDSMEYMEIGDVMDSIVTKSGKAVRKKELYTTPFQHTIQSGYLIPVCTTSGSLGQKPGYCFSGQYVEPNQVKLPPTLGETNTGYNSADETNFEQNRAAISCHDYIDIVSDTVIPETSSKGEYIDMQSEVEERKRGMDSMGDGGYIDMYNTESHNSP